MASLIFPPGSGRDGFSNYSLSAFDGNPEPIIRELIQNSLDAWLSLRDQDGCAEISFVIKRVPLTDLPDFDSYKQAFESAVAIRKKRGSMSKDEEKMIARIKAIIEVGEMDVLYCIDNGCGLDDGRMNSLLYQGNTEKGETASAGSFGIGHITAFAASDLHYVLYGGIAQSNGAQPECYSGHAILAAHQIEDTIRSADGFYVEELETEDITQPHRFASDPPKLLRCAMDGIREKGTGSVVCMTGFNNFRDPDEEDDNIGQIIAQVAAKNFLPAVFFGQMKVNVNDQRVDGEPIEVSQSTLGWIMGEVKKQKVASKRNYPAGLRVYEAWRTLKDGQEIEVDNARLFYRLLTIKNDVGTQVNLFRNGMWISSRPEKLRRSDFANVNSFDAVVLLDEGELYRLVRDAEGPEHLGIEPLRLDRKVDRKRLRYLLDTLANALCEQAGPIEKGDVLRPTQFALFDMGEAQSTKIPRRLPRSEGQKEGTDEEESKDDEVDISKNKNVKPRGGGGGSSPKSGSVVNTRFSIGPYRANEKFITVVWEVLEKVDNSSAVGLRVRWDSGSDETCEKPYQSDWIKIESLTYCDGDNNQKTVPNTVDSEGRGSYEIILPPDFKKAVAINLEEPLPSDTGISLDFVRRKVPTKSKKK